MALPLALPLPLCPDESQCPHFVQQLVQTALAEEHEELAVVTAPESSEGEEEGVGVRRPQALPWRHRGN